MKYKGTEMGRPDLAQLYAAYPMTERQLTRVIDRMPKGELSPEENQRCTLLLDMRDWVKDKFNLWPAGTLDNPNPYIEDN